MGLPTFDFSNIIKSIIGKSISTIYSPLTLFIALAGAVGALGASVYTVINSFAGGLPSVPSFSLQSVFDYATSDFGSLIVYITCADDFVLVFNLVISLVNWIMVFIPTFFLTLLISCLVYRFSLTVRSAILSSVFGQ